MTKQSISIALCNDFTLDQDGWALIAPFGEHPLKRMVTKPDGKIALENYVQVVDEQAATDIMSSENSFFRKLRRATVGIPVYNGHEDIRDYAPENLAPGKPPGQRKVLGVMDKVRRSDRGIEAHFSLTPDGATAIENEGCKYTSVFWLVDPFEMRGETIVARPFKLLSVGLTDEPNLSGVDALANAKVNLPEQPTQQVPETIMKNQLLGWLCGQGVSLANDASETAVLDAIQKRLTSLSGEVTALSNEKTNLNTKITGLESEKVSLTTKLTEAGTALANSQGEFKKAHNGRCAALVDLVIQQGKLAVADRDAKIVALENSKSFDADVTALNALPVTFKVQGGATEERKALANANMANPRELLLGKVKALTAANPGMDYSAAYKQASAENPALVEAMKTSAGK